MGLINAKVEFVGNLPFDKFEIPSYQRPYKWSTNNVLQLLNDINENLGKSEYRIGSIILHNPNMSEGQNSIYNIVDGQQRITTIVLLMKYLGLSSNNYNVEYPHYESQQNIIKNAATIQNWIDNHLSEERKKEFADFLMSKCSVVFVEVDDVSEAFQMFDSQNGRGKELKAYNLLKAFHLRAIDKEHSRVILTEEKVKYDTSWEENTSFNNDEDYLSTITELLYRIRLWSRRRNAYSFDKSKIDEFKGIQVEDIKYPCQNFAKLLFTFLYANSNHDNLTLVQRSRETTHSSEKALLQNINLPIINGAPFFEFILAQIENYKILFRNPVNDERLMEFRNDYEIYCHYSGHSGSGDSYVRNLYKALILAVYDKFGAEGMSKMYPTLYMISYRIRLEYKQVRYTTVAQYPLDEFDIIQSSWKLRDLYRLETKARKDVGVRYYNDRIESIIRFFTTHGVNVYAKEDFNDYSILTGQSFNKDGKAE